ncbi:4-coumarate--CoA ligase-like 5 [Apostasia shenzhenica]|uniref:4-coumarate--CoA ligase n=1 Tax=Apostasia shenzhenica TaxID=1088818 RepID=A0A2I0AGF2_9ASPA|nr:4-coumarate--CoA ligase-like 5 [Apostasia shenzhenica]
MPPPPAPEIDTRSGYCRATKTFHSLSPAVPLPCESLPLSVSSFVLSLLPSPLPSNPAFTDADSGNSLSYPDFLSQVRSLASSLRSRLALLPGDSALVLSPNRLEIPVLYFALLSIGAIPCPSNPISSPSELARQIRLSRPKIAFAISTAAPNLPESLPSILIDSAHFQSLLLPTDSHSPLPEIMQSDTAAVLYSSGTTGDVKGVVLTHRNFIALLAGIHAGRLDRDSPAFRLFTIPLFHVFGFSRVLRIVAQGETAVLMKRFDFVGMLRAVERFRVNHILVSPPVVVAMLKSDEARRRDLSSLKTLGCGGAPLRREVIERFVARFPTVQIIQGYGMTETSAATTMTSGLEESDMFGSVGRISVNLQARIVEPGSGESLPPGCLGELWLRGPTIMKGYIGDDEATTSTLDTEGWLKTGDLCYFNEDGFLFIVDRLKELIKYKAYQVPPVELEHILHSHPEIVDAAVIPYPDEAAGQIPMAYVTRRPGSTISSKAVMDFVAKQVSPYKKIRRVEFIDAIPKTPAGKILRRELISLALSKPKSKL